MGVHGEDTGDRLHSATENSQIGLPYMKDNFMALYLVSTIGCGTRYCGFHQVDRITIHAKMNYEQRS